MEEDVAHIEQACADHGGIGSELTAGTLFPKVSYHNDLAARRELSRGGFGAAERTKLMAAGGTRCGLSVTTFP
jgi:hypothetical protein